MPSLFWNIGRFVKFSIALELVAETPSSCFLLGIFLFSRGLGAPSRRDSTPYCLCHVALATSLGEGKPELVRRLCWE